MKSISNQGNRQNNQEIIDKRKCFNKPLRVSSYTNTCKQLYTYNIKVGVWGVGKVGEMVGWEGDKNGGECDVGGHYTAI